MARGKKLFLQIAALAMSATMAIGFAACSDGGQKEHQHADVDGDGYCDTDGTWIGEGEDPALHEHTYDTTKWAYDSTYHYHAGNCGHDVMKDRERHSFNGDEAKCTVCDYTRNFDEIYQMYLGGAIQSLRDAGVSCNQSKYIQNWESYKSKAYKLDYDAETQIWKSHDSIELSIADQVVVINAVSHTQYGFNNGTTQYGVKVEKEGKYFVSLKLGEITPVLTKDYGDHTHTYEQWGFDAENHWKQCAEDGEKDLATVAPHDFGDDGHCKQEGCEAISQEKCQHAKGFSFNYSMNTLPATSTGKLVKVCPDCGKEQVVEYKRGYMTAPTCQIVSPADDGQYYFRNHINVAIGIDQPGTYTLTIVEPVWDDGVSLSLTALAANSTNVHNGSVSAAQGYRPESLTGAIYDYGLANGCWIEGETTAKWQNKITINGQPAAQYTDKWAEFKSISVVVTEEDIAAVEQTYTKPSEEGEEPKPLPKKFYFDIFAVAKTDKDPSTYEMTPGGWLCTLTKGDLPVVSTCEHEDVTFDKADVETAYTAGKATPNEAGTVKATCKECQEEVQVPYDKILTALGGVSVTAAHVYEVGTKYFIGACGHMSFKITEPGTYTLLRTAVYTVPNVADDPDTADKDETENYAYYVGGVYVNYNATKGSKAKGDAIYYQGQWQEAKQDWYSKIKFNGQAGGSGFDKKSDIMSITITVTAEDLASVPSDQFLFITIGIYFGAESSTGWTASKAGHYEFVQMTKETPAAATVSAQEVALLPEKNTMA